MYFSKQSHINGNVILFCWTLNNVSVDNKYWIITSIRFIAVINMHKVRTQTEFQEHLPVTFIYSNILNRNRHIFLFFFVEVN